MQPISAIRRDPTIPSPIVNPHRKRGFTLLELIGVLAILAILASIVTPPVIQTIERQMREAEDKELGTLKEGVLASVEEDQLVPGTNWVSQIAPYVRHNQAEIQSNGRGNARHILIDPAFFSSSSPIARQPTVYDQNSDGPESSEPESPRLIILSSIGPKLPDPDNIDFDFNEVWDWDATSEQLPSSNSPWDSWSGDADDLRVARINLKTHFKKVVLRNVEFGDESGDPPRYLFQGQSSPPSKPISEESWYALKGTSLELYIDSNDDGDVEDSGEWISAVNIDGDKSLYFNEWKWTSEFQSSGGLAFLETLQQQMKDWVDEYGHTLGDMNIEVKEKKFSIQVP